jgi:serine phosphatase RsbU (regulator of sigma subunit)
MIFVSTALLIVVVSTFGFINNQQSRRLIDASLARIQHKISENLEQAGSAQVQLLAQAVRVALVQSDYYTIEAIVRDMKRHDPRITAIAVVDRSNRVLAHSDPKLIGQEASGVWRGQSAKVTSRLGVQLAGEPSILFTSPMQDKLEVIEEDEAGASIVTKTQKMALGHVHLAYSLRSHQRELAAAELAKQQEVSRSLRSLLTVGLGAILLGVLLTVLQSLRMSRPIKELAVQANRMSKGDLTARVDVASRDEIGWLGLQFNDMAERMQELVQSEKESAALEKELEVAAVVQSTLVPDNAVTTLGGLQLAGYFKAAAKCGGDWWSYYQLQEDQVLVIISDVTGHGIASAMITAAAKGVTNTLLGLTGGRIELPVLLRSLNDTICSTGKGRFAMTCFASIYDARAKTLTYANAGHNFPYLYDATKRELSALALPGDRLGDFPEVRFDVDLVELKTDDTLVWYTDGLVEGEDATGLEYGERRLQTTIQAHAHLPPDQALDQITRQATEFYGEVPQKDDITLIVGKVC